MSESDSPSCLESRLNYVYLNLVGQVVVAHLSDGAVMEGLFASCDESTGDIILAKSRLKTSKKHAGDAPADCRDRVRISGDEVVVLEAIDVTFRTQGAAMGSVDHLRRGMENFQKWSDVKEDDEFDDGAWVQGGWDQFKGNEKFGVKNTYKDELYTTKLDKSKFSRKQLEEAARMEREINSSATSFGIQHELERHADPSSTIPCDEEAETFSNVRRHVPTIVRRVRPAAQEEFLTAFLSETDCLSAPDISSWIPTWEGSGQVWCDDFDDYDEDEFKLLISTASNPSPAHSVHRKPSFRRRPDGIRIPLDRIQKPSEASTPRTDTVFGSGLQQRRERAMRFSKLSRNTSFPRDPRDESVSSMNQSLTDPPKVTLPTPTTQPSAGHGLSQVSVQVAVPQVSMVPKSPGVAVKGNSPLWQPSIQVGVNRTPLPHSPGPNLTTPQGQAWEPTSPPGPPPNNPPSPERIQHNPYAGSVVGADEPLDPQASTSSPPPNSVVGQRLVVARSNHPSNQAPMQQPPNAHHQPRGPMTSNTLPPALPLPSHSLPPSMGPPLSTADVQAILSQLSPEQVNQLLQQRHAPDLLPPQPHHQQYSQLPGGMMPTESPFDAANTSVQPAAKMRRGRGGKM